MRIKLIPRIGGAPLVLEVSEFVVLNDLDTPVSVGAVYGPDSTIAVSCVGCADFLRMLKTLGIEKTVVIDKLVLPKPDPGMRLIAGPRS